MDEPGHGLLRHSRHALLTGFDDEGVEAVRAARALVIGAGGLGCPAATYLVASGIGVLHWIDGDDVDGTNLGRQVLFGPDDIGHPKTIAGARALARINPDTQIIAETVYADGDMLDRMVPLADVVLDCTDRWETRQAINAACVRLGIPLVSAAAIEWSGQLLAIDPQRQDHACYACVFDPAHAPPAAACGAYGVLSPMVGAMGCLQAAEAIKLLLARRCAITQEQTQLLSLLDMRSGRWQQLKVARNPTCSVCAGVRTE